MADSQAPVSTKGRLIQVKSGLSADFSDDVLKVAEFGLILDKNELRIGLADGTTMKVNGGDGINIDDIPDASLTQKGLMTQAHAVKLNGISSGANFVQVEDNLTSTSATSALSAKQGKVLKDAIDAVGSGGSGGTSNGDSFIAKTPQPIWDVDYNAIESNRVYQVGDVNGGTNIPPESWGVLWDYMPNVTYRVQEFLGILTSKRYIRTWDGNVWSSWRENGGSREYNSKITTSWNGTVAPYTQEIAISGILATDNPFVRPTFSEDNNIAIAESNAWNQIGKITTGENKLIVTCFESKPTTEINIFVKVV